MTMHLYEPSNWFWVVGGDESRAWSSAAGAYVTEYPADALTRISSEAELMDVLAVYNLHGPVVSVPQSVTPYQARQALNAAGLRDVVEAAVAAASDEVRDAWEYGISVERGSPFIVAMAGALALTDGEIDDLFIAAASY